MKNAREEVDALLKGAIERLELMYGPNEAWIYTKPLLEVIESLRARQ